MLNACDQSSQDRQIFTLARIRVVSIDLLKPIFAVCVFKCTCQFKLSDYDGKSTSLYMQPALFIVGQDVANSPACNRVRVGKRIILLPFIQKAMSVVDRDVLQLLFWCRLESFF